MANTRWRLTETWYLLKVLWYTRPCHRDRRQTKSNRVPTGLL